MGLCWGLGKPCSSEDEQAARSCPSHGLCLSSSPAWLSEGEAARGRLGAQHHSCTGAQDQAGPGLASQLMSHTVCEQPGALPRTLLSSQRLSLCLSVLSVWHRGCCCLPGRVSVCTGLTAEAAAFGTLCLSQGSSPGWDLAGGRITAVSCSTEERKVLLWSCAGEEPQPSAPGCSRVMDGLGSSLSRGMCAMCLLYSWC